MVQGGLRTRLTIESVTKAIEAYLDGEGWFDIGREHLPVTLLDEFPGDNDEVALNTLAFSADGGSGVSAEMGSLAENHFMSLFVDFFAENDALGRHLIGDVYYFLKTNPALPVYDYTDTTPFPILFHVHVEEEDVDWRKPSRAVSAWQKHWFTCSFTIEDERANDG